MIFIEMKKQLFTLSEETLDFMLFRLTREEMEEYLTWLDEAIKTGNYSHTFSTDLLNEFQELVLVK